MTFSSHVATIIFCNSNRDSVTELEQCFAGAVDVECFEYGPNFTKNVSIQYEIAG